MLKKILQISFLTSSFCISLPKSEMPQFLEKVDKITNHMGVGVRLGQILAYSFFDESIATILWQAKDITAEFKQLVQEQCAIAGVENAATLFVKVSPAANEQLFVALNNGIIVSQAIYDLYLNGKSDIEVVKFLIRHEASHIKNKDVLNRLGADTLIFAISFYGIDYLSDVLVQTSKVPTSWENMPWYVKFYARCATKFLLYFLAMKRVTLWQEMRADQEAAVDPVMAEAGARCFERIANFQKEQGNFIGKIGACWPTASKLCIGYQCHEERCQTLREYARKLKLKEEELTLASKSAVTPLGG